MNSVKFLSVAVFVPLLFIEFSCQSDRNQEINTEEMIVRIAEIEVNAEDIDTYLSILKEEAAASVKLESGAISIFPMVISDSPNQVRIIEIYASQAAYEAHLETPHFIKYKTSTESMVRSLKLVDMEAVDAETMGEIFRKVELQ